MERMDPSTNVYSDSFMQAPSLSLSSCKLSQSSTVGRSAQYSSSSMLLHATQRAPVFRTAPLWSDKYSLLHDILIDD
jgi:hypothetical protein